MIKQFFLIVTLCLAGMIIQAQSADDYRDGYALKGKDTIWCKVRFSSKHDHPLNTVTLLLDNEEAIFHAGGPITGFGAEEDGKKYDYGIVDVDIAVPNRRIANLLFIKKIVAGTIDLYEHSYSIYSTTRTTVNGIEKPGSAITNTQRFTNHYIAKTDSLSLALATPVLLSSFRKKDLEPYISDDADLVANTEKRFSLKELITLLKDYNNRSLEKKKNSK